MLKSSFTVSGVKTPTAVAESAQIVDTYSVATALLTNVDMPGVNIVNCPPSSDHLGAASQSLSVCPPVWLRLSWSVCSLFPPPLGQPQ